MSTHFRFIAASQPRNPPMASSTKVNGVNCVFENMRTFEECSRIGNRLLDMALNVASFPASPRGSHLTTPQETGEPLLPVQPYSLHIEGRDMHLDRTSRCRRHDSKGMGPLWHRQASLLISKQI